MTGTITRIVRDRGFGFIRDDDSATDFYFHLAHVVGRSGVFASMLEGDAVTFERDPVQATDTPNPEAINVRWQPAETAARRPSHLFRAAGAAVSEALALLNARAAADDRWDNAMLGTLLRHLPDQLRAVADVLDAKPHMPSTPETESRFRTCQHSYCTNAARDGHDTCAGHDPETVQRLAARVSAHTTS